MTIKNLSVEIEGKKIIKNFNLKIGRGELHVLMGPNGSGKSTLARAIVAPDVFLGFQNPVTVPGVNFVTFMRLAYRKLDPLSFYRYLKSKAKLLNIPEEWLSRNVNEGFSGGEKKRMEMLQALVLQPKFAILDEPDTGVDFDSLKLIAKAIKILLRSSGILLITHNPKILKLLEVDFVHILKNGVLVKSGNKNLIKIIEKEGYAKF
ncbi:MAG: ABC transporter ATP-binding protein [bacterium]|nr:ABC transporter ATP-binding protein [bacterium]